MPDQNNPTDTNLNPSQVNPPSEPTQMPETPPVSDFSGDASIPPPFPPETSPIEGAPPTFDIPPVVTPVGKPKGGGKKVIATILGLLVLVGGLGAGIILVRQQQDIREKAAVIDCVGEGGTCYPTNYTCSDNITIGTNCPSGKKCSFGTCRAPAPTPPPTTKCTDVAGQYCTADKCSDNGDVGGTGGGCPSNSPNCCKPGGGKPTSTPKSSPSPSPASCTRIPTSALTRETGDSLTITQDDLNKCKQYCPDGQLFAARYKCDGINLSAGCQENGISLDASVGKSYPVGNLTCGTVQIDVGCKNASGTWGSVKFLVKSAATACVTASPPGGGPTAQCLNIKAFDTEWNQLTNAQLSELKPGDKVRFTVAGQASSGNFDKAKFKINSVQRPEVTGKRPATEEYFDEFTLPEGITTFTVNAQIHHTTLGWSN